MDYNVRYTKVSADRASQRIDNYLFVLAKGVPKSHVYRLLRTGQVRVNKKRVKCSYRLKTGDILRIPPVRQAESLGHIAISADLCQSIEQRILYEDERLIVVDKPAGLACHRGSEIRYGLIDIIRQLRLTSPYIGLVHRLDRGTSGCLMLAKDRKILQDLQIMLQAGLVEKTYLALVENRWDLPESYLVEQSLKRDCLSSGERVVKASDEGKSAMTRFKISQRFNDCSLVFAYPITGRTHQIRVHAANLGYPIIGDTKYAHHKVNRKIRALGCKRLFLHASCIKVRNNLLNLSVHAPLASQLQQVLDGLATELI